jgi:hypothetical protein
MARSDYGTLTLAFATLLLACTSHHTRSPDASTRLDGSAARADAPADAAADGGVDCTPVATGGGWIGRACVHEVPSGSAISLGDGGTTFVTLGGKIIARYGACPCKAAVENHIGPPVPLDASAAPDADQPPEDAGSAAADGGGLCVHARGGRCGGNIANPCTCASGLTCSPTDGGVPFGDVGGTCR